MQEVLINPPRTVMEVFKMLPEGTLAEIIENTLYMSPTPISKHQRIIVTLLTQISLHIEKNNLGEVFTALLDVYLDEHKNAVQPDILFISKTQAHIVEDDGHIHGTPDLIIEILSPGNKKHDTVTKKNLYEKFGVKEYWIIDADTKFATGYSLQNKSYTLIGEESGKIVSVLLAETFSF